MKNILLVIPFIIAGCTSTTGVVATGKDSYMIAREDNSPTASLGAIKATTFKEASQFCAAKGKALQVIKENDVPRSFGQFPQTNLQFRCE